jgi:hypothetical protein
MEQNNMERDELDRRISLIKERLERGQLQIHSKSTLEALIRVRIASDGKVDPGTVDSSVRALANAVTFMDYRQQLKQIPIKGIQEQYYEMLEQFFGVAFQEMRKHKVTPHDIACSMASKKSLVKALQHDADAFQEGILGFWKVAGPGIEAFVQDFNGLKTVYGGDIFPPYEDGILSRTGLYVDLIVLPDPLLRIVPLLKLMTPERSTYYLAKHALSALALKDIILADLDPPLAVIAPDYFLLDENTQAYVQRVGESDSVIHLEHVFGIKPGVITIADYLETITDIKQLESALREPARLLFDTQWHELSLEKQIERLRGQNADFTALERKEISLADVISMSVRGRMMQANDLVFKANRLGGVPLIDAPTSWQYLLWKYEYDQEQSKETGDLKNAFLVNSLQHSNLRWIGNIALGSILTLRKEGALTDLRNNMRRAIDNIATVSEEGYEDTVRCIVAELDAEFGEHSRELAALASRNRKFYGFEVSSLLVTGGISIAAALGGNIPLSVIAAVSGLAGLPSGRDLWRKGRELIKEKCDLRRSPVGLLFEAKNKSSK